MILGSKEKKTPRVGIGVLVFNEMAQLLLGKRKNSHGEATWGLPGGHLEYGESLEDCAVREVKEETSLNVASPVFYAMTNDVFTSDDKHYISIFMIAYSLDGQDAQIMEPNKAEKWCWFNLENLATPLFPPLESLLLGQSYGTASRLQKFAHFVCDRTLASGNSWSR